MITQSMKGGIKQEKIEVEMPELEKNTKRSSKHFFFFKNCRHETKQQREQKAKMQKPKRKTRIQQQKQ